MSTKSKKALVRPISSPVSQHHVWCKLFFFVDADNCPMCKRLREDFAEDGTLQEKYLNTKINIVGQTKYFVKTEGDNKSRFSLTGDWPASAMRAIQKGIEASGFNEVTGSQYLKFRLSYLSWREIARSFVLIILAIAVLAWLAENFMKKL